MFDRFNLAEDLIDCRGDVLGRRGLVVSPEAIADAAQRAPPAPRKLLRDTALAPDVAGPLDEPAYAHIFARHGVREAVEDALLGVRLPEVLFEEMLAIRRAAPALHRHAFATAAVSVRMLLAAVGRARSLPELAAAALFHDLGMRDVPARLLEHEEQLPPAQAQLIAVHPLLGAYHLACVLGAHPAVAAARSHHWRCGQGYPGLTAPPSRSIEVVAVASAFAALTQPRPFRSAAYDARGAVDELAREVLTGRADANTVKLLVHALRGGAGDLRALKLGKNRDGHAPEVNLHASVSAPVRGLL